MAGMNRSLALLPVFAAGLALAACGGGAKQAADHTTAPPTTIAGVGVKTSGLPPKPNTSTACSHRWNGAANASGREAAKHRAPKADGARVQTATRSGYFSEDAGRCLIYVITPHKSSVVFIETEPGRFTFTADATGHFSANADLQQNGRLHLR